MVVSIKDKSMVFIQISGKHDSKAFMLLAKSGSPVTCLAGNIYGVNKEHLRMLKSRKIQFKTLPAGKVHLPKSPVAA